MKKVKGLFAVILVFCMITSTVSFPVVASDSSLVVTRWKSSDYLDPDNPVTEDNPWSLESTNNASNTYEVFDGTTMKETEQALFPEMPDGFAPETAYIVNGEANWGNQGYNMAVNGKYMIPASIYSGNTPGTDDVKTASSKLAKVFTVPMEGTVKISAAATYGAGSEGKILTMTLAANSWDAPRQNWNIIKDGEILATANGASRVSAGSYDTIDIDTVTVDVSEGDKIYFEFAPSSWTIRADQAIMWDPVVEYVTGDDIGGEGAEVDDTDYFVSSKYLNPEVPYIDNPWTVESTNNYPDRTWQVVTNTTPHTAEEPLFPEMPDGESPEIAYVTTGDYSNGWGSNSVNTAVNGKYMIGGSRWYNGSDANVSATAKIAKVFTAPKSGTINITAVATMGEGSENLIVPAKTIADTDDDGLSWTVIKDEDTLWTATGNERIVGDDYDKILFNDITIEINEGDKIYFALNPQYGGARSAQACLWDPAIRYLEFNEVDDTDSFTSSKYLNPDVRYADNPWSVEVVNSLEGVWESVTGTTPALTHPALEAYPDMPDGETPASGYFHSGESWLVDGWNVDAYNAMVSGKYMVSPVTYESGAWKVPEKAKVAKVFTAPREGKLKITAGATISGETEGLIISNAAEDWELDGTTWSVEKADGTVLWSKDGSGRNKESGYHSVEFENMYVDVAPGEKLYFILSGRCYASRNSHTCMWDPVVEYVTDEEGDDDGEDDDEEYGDIVDDTDYFLSSKYLDPEVPYIGNPWTVESTNNYPDRTWQVVKNTTPHTAEEPLFPEMPDGKSPTTAYVTTGDYSNGWGSNSVNTAVNGKYMVGGSRWYNGSDANVSATARIAKVFTAPKAGTIRISANATMGYETRGLIVPVKTTASTDDDGLSWSVEKADGTKLWSKTGNDRTVGADYDGILFEDIILDIAEGEKLYFSINPQYGGPRSVQACLWDPAIRYLEEAEEAEAFVSADYLNPDAPYRNNPWVAAYQLDDGTWTQMTSTAIAMHKVSGADGFDLFPVMPDGMRPEVAYTYTGRSDAPGWDVDAYNAAISGKYMSPAAFYEKTKNPYWCTVDNKIAKIFTVPKAGKLKITAAATNGDGTEGLIAVSADSTAQQLAVVHNETEIWSAKSDSFVNNDSLAEDGCGYIAFKKKIIDVEEGDKIYFTFSANKWLGRMSQYAMWDPVVEYTTEDEEDDDEGDEGEGEIVDDTTYFLSSKYLTPEKPYKNNPWTVESNNNLEKTWQVVTNTEPHEAEFDLFPEMPDGVQPTTAYVQTGDINTNWGSNGVNIAVNGKYMVGASIWYNGSDVQTTASCKIAKVFVAPADGKIKITAAAVMGEGSEGRIVPVRVTEASSTGSGQAWILEKNDTKLWSASGDMREMTVNYDYIEFPERTMTVKAGDKLRFVFQPLGWSKPRQEQACIWDPAIEYISFGTEGDGEGSDTPEENDPNSFLSSYYLDPDDQKENSPWTVESTNNNAGEWGQITNTTLRTDVTYPLFPVMPDGEQPVTGYVQTGEDYNTYWSTQGFEMAINGKYIIPAAFWTNDTRTAKAKISKLFTAPKAGMIRITAEAVMGEGSEHLIVPAKVSEEWETSEDLAWIVEKNGVQIWKRDGTQRDVGAEYDSVRFDPMIIEVNEGDKIRFVFQPKSYAERANMACMWDPRVTYIGDPIILSEDSRDKSGILCPVDHSFEITLTGEPLKAITAENIVISGGKAKAVDVSMEGTVLKFGIEGLEVNSSYELTVKNILYALIDDEPYMSEVKITFNTTDMLSLGSDIYAEGGLSVGNNTIKTTVVCSDTGKIASGDEVVLIASVLNADGTVHSVKLAKAVLSARVTPIECEVSVAGDQTVRVWVADSLDNIKPVGGRITDITQ